MRRLVASLLCASALSLSGTQIQAEGHRPSLLSYFSFDTIVQRLLQSGVMALRTQVDLKYSDMSVDLRTGGITFTDVAMWPLPEWAGGADCKVSIDRITFRGGALDQPDRVRMKAQASGINFDDICLPPEAREPLAMAGMRSVQISRLTFDVDYGVPSSDATVRAFADIEGVATADLTAHMAYVWFDGREDMEEPMPVVYLDSATLTLENQGIWSTVSGMVPPQFTGEGAALTVEGAIGQGLMDLNRQAWQSEDHSLSDSQRVFIASVKETWPAFLRNPTRLVLETGIEGDVYLDFEAMEDDPREMFNAMRPRLSLAPARAQYVLPLGLLQQSMDDGARLLSDEDRRWAGIALVTGVGAPRNIDAGERLLSPMAQAGDGQAALVLAKAAEHRAPEVAYRYALIAGGAGERGATALLDRIEDTLPMGQILGLQMDISRDDIHDRKALRSIGDLRDQAAMRLSGRGMARSYGIAAMWAMIGTAAGDPESSDILAEIDERIRLAGPEAQDAWGPVEDDASRMAMEVWVNQDLASRYAR